MGHQLETSTDNTKITTIEQLEKEFLAIGLKESSMEEFQEYKDYSLDGDKDPRMKYLYKIYQKGCYFCFIFVKKENEIYSSRGFGGFHPDGVWDVLKRVEWHDEDMGDEEY